MSCKLRSVGGQFTEQNEYVELTFFHDIFVVTKVIIISRHKRKNRSNFKSKDIFNRVDASVTKGLGCLFC